MIWATRRRDTDKHASMLRSAERSEVLFACAAIGLAAMVGFVQPGRRIEVQILIVVWSGLVGMMIPRIVDSRRPRIDLTVPDRPVVDHDIASALLMIEGGVTAIRWMHVDQECGKVESIAHAIDTEIRRIRRLSSSRPSASLQSSIVELLEPPLALHRANGASINCNVSEPPLIAIARDDLAGIFVNLLDNCARHAPGAGVCINGRPVGSSYELVFSDNGPGITSDIADRAAERGISSRPGGGLGLYSVRSIVESAGGEVTIQSPDLGTSIRLVLPVAAWCDDSHSAFETDNHYAGRAG